MRNPNNIVTMDDIHHEDFEYLQIAELVPVNHNVYD